MFDTLFKEYKDKVLKRLYRKIGKTDVVLLGPFLVLLVFIFLFGAVWINQMVIVILSCGLVIYMAVFIRYYDNRDRKLSEERLQHYKDTRIGPLIRLLDKENCNLCSECSIDWLIECCREVLKDNAKNEFSELVKTFPISVILPFIILFSNLVINNSEITVALSFIGILIVALSMVFLTMFAITKAISKILFPDKWRYERFRDDLGYIKTQINRTELASKNCSS